jgi:hypothetical protein
MDGVNFSEKPKTTRKRKAPEPQLAILKRFWNEFAPGDPIRLRFIKTDRSAPPAEFSAPTVEDAWPTITSFTQRGYETYYFCNRVPASQDGFATDEHVETVRAFVLDFDHGMPEFWHIPPDFVVWTSKLGALQKAQVLWRASGCPTDKFEETQRRLLEQYAAAKPDISVVNLSRVLRLPGSLHQKDPANVQLVDFHADENRSSHSFEDFTRDLPSVPEKKQSSPSDGRDVHLDFLMELLPFVDPTMCRKQWFAVLGGFANTNFYNGEGELLDSLELANRWSAGFWSGSRDGSPFWTWDGVPANYDGFDDVRKAFESKHDRSSFGSIYWHAERGGWIRHSSHYDGPTYDDGLTEDDTIEDNGPTEEGQEGKKAESGPRLYSTTEMSEWPTPEPLVDRFITDQSNVVFFGEPKSGKSFIALDTALSIAANVDVLKTNKVRRTGLVVYFTGEGIVGFYKRIDAWLKYRGLKHSDITNFKFCPEVPIADLDVKRNVQKCQAFIDKVTREKGQPAFIVFDTMSRVLRGMEENSSASANLYHEITEKFRNDLKCTVLTVAHCGKDRTKGIRGSSAFDANFDAIWSTDKDDATRTVKLEIADAKDVDTDDVDRLYFRLFQQDLGNGQTSAALEAVRSDQFKKGAAKKKEQNDDLVAVHEALKDRGAYPGGSSEYVVTEYGKKGTGGVTTQELSEATSITEHTLRRYAGKEAAFKPYIPYGAGNGQRGYVWAITSTVELP